MGRDNIFLECTTCGNRYYRTSKDSTKQKKIEVPKFCGLCRKHTPHKERKK